MSKVYDCFNFYNEMDLLDLRLSELYDVVDHFVLVENTVTHIGNPKPLFYEENKERYEKFSDKIIHVVIDDMVGKSRSEIDLGSKDRCVDGLGSATNDDIVLYSDLDEIPFAHTIELAKEHCNHGFVTFKGRFYCYYLNGLRMEKDGTPKQWWGTIGGKWGNIQSTGLGFNDLRNHRDKHPAFHVMENSSGHFSFIGDAKMIETKLRNWGHAVDLGRDFIAGVDDVEGKIQSYIDEGKYLFKDEMVQYVPIDDKHFPSHVFNNQDKYSKLIRNEQCVM